MGLGHVPTTEPIKTVMNTVCSGTSGSHVRLRQSGRAPQKKSQKKARTESVNKMSLKGNPGF
jgi:hypothetical protein